MLLYARTVVVCPRRWLLVVTRKTLLQLRRLQKDRLQKALCFTIHTPKYRPTPSGARAVLSVSSAGVRIALPLAPSDNIIPRRRQAFCDVEKAGAAL